MHMINKATNSGNNNVEMLNEVDSFLTEEVETEPTIVADQITIINNGEHHVVVVDMTTHTVILAHDPIMTTTIVAVVVQTRIIEVIVVVITVVAIAVITITVMDIKTLLNTIQTIIKRNKFVQHHQTQLTINNNNDL